MQTAPDAVPGRLTAAFADKYRIEREIGAGGSATVYLAEDLKHHRRVAIKVLKPQLAAALGPDRFEDEVQIAARLHHPHILAVFDSGEADGYLYYVMPYVDGPSLRDRMEDGLMSFPKVAKLLAEVADALAYAHAQGIVHRDIKPENILFSGKHVVVTDFGIAKAISDAAERKSSTSMGLALGTPAYMAPEQASSDPTLDHRADLYSLGIVGYELLVGHPPFSGSAQQILSAHLTTKPEPVAALRQGVPPALANIVMHALAKAPGDRWPSAEAMQAQLEPLSGTTSNSGWMATVALPSGRRAPTRAVTVGLVSMAVLALGAFAWNRAHTLAAPASIATTAAVAPAAIPVAKDPNAIPDIASDHSIAVLPFKNMSSDKEQEFFSDGISEDLLNLLAKLPDLRVIARSSSFQFKDQDIGIQEIARKLHVAAVLDGSVRKSGNTVRISTQLIRASDGSQLWSETYDRKIDDVFKVQDEIAAKVVDKLKLTLLGAAPVAAPVDPRVYPLFLQAQAIANTGSRESRVKAIALYKRVLAVSPNESRAWLGLARMYLNQRGASEVGLDEGARIAREAIGNALRLDPKSGRAHSYLANLANSLGDLETAVREHEQALALEPGSVPILANASMLLAATGHLDDAIAIRRYALERDPANNTLQSSLCGALFLAQQWSEAMETCQAAAALSPDGIATHATIAELLLHDGKLDQAWAEAKLESDEGSRLVMFAKIRDAMGRRQESDAFLAELIKKFGGDYPNGPAEVYASRGDADKAFEWLGRAVSVKDPSLTSIAIQPPFFKLHADPRWLPFLRKIGKAPEQLAKIHFKVNLPK